MAAVRVPVVAAGPLLGLSAAQGTTRNVCFKLLIVEMIQVDWGCCKHMQALHAGEAHALMRVLTKHGEEALSTVAPHRVKQVS